MGHQSYYTMHEHDRLLFRRMLLLGQQVNFLELQNGVDKKHRRRATEYPMLSDAATTN